MGASRWERLSDKEVSDYEVFCVRKVEAKSPRTGDAHPFHVLEIPDFVVTIAETVGREFVLVEQYRAGVDDLSLEFPAGTVGEGEDAVDAALRELREETGYTCASATKLAVLQPDPALMMNRITVVVAEGCRCTAERSQDDAEDVHPRLLSAVDVEAMIDEGRIKHVTAVASWLLFRRSRGGR